MGEREKIPPGQEFSNGVIFVQKDPAFGWVILLRESDTSPREAHTFDELDDETLAIVLRNSKDEVFPDEFREYLSEFDTRTPRERTRRLH